MPVGLANLSDCPCATVTNLDCPRKIQSPRAVATAGPAGFFRALRWAQAIVTVTGTVAPRLVRVALEA